MTGQSNYQEDKRKEIGHYATSLPIQKKKIYLEPNILLD